MKLADIKQHLRPYSIVQRRRTTINHAFASALAPCDPYDEQRLQRAMAMLGQSNLNQLVCVYCSAAAETWDHLVGLVKNSELNGYGHQIGNLVPCCRSCNSLKGNRGWQEFVNATIAVREKREQIGRMLTSYLKEFAVEVDLQRAQTEFPAEWQRYIEIKQQVVALMAEADLLASQLRLKAK